MWTAPAVAAAAMWGRGSTKEHTASAADSSPLGPVSAALRSFSAELYQSLITLAAVAGDDEARQSIVCSPYSVATALAMARAGARGRTAEEMDRVLHAPAPVPQALDTGLDALRHTLSSAYTDPTGDGTKRPRFDVANSLWAQQDLTIQRAFLDTLSRFYDAGLNTVDFQRATERARVAINAWVSARTNDKIPELLDKGVLTPDTVLVVTNAIYLMARWEYPFDPAATKDGTFTRDDGRSVSVPMMNSASIEIGYQEGEGWRAADAPYVGQGLAMAIVVPTRGALSDVEQQIDGAWLTRLLAGFERASLRLHLPRWTFRHPSDLGFPLSRMGMPTAFTPKADFSGITLDTSLCISKVIHEAFIAVDEKGTEAAAATAVSWERTGGTRPTRLAVDRPFLYVIHDVNTGTPMFVGRVTDPTVTA